MDFILIRNCHKERVKLKYVREVASTRWQVNKEKEIS